MHLPAQVTVLLGDKPQLFHKKTKQKKMLYSMKIVSIRREFVRIHHIIRQIIYYIPFRQIQRMMNT